MRILKVFLTLLLILTLCVVAGAVAEEVEVAEGVFHGFAGEALDRGIYHTQYPEISEFTIAEDGSKVKPGDTIHFSMKPIVADTTIDDLYAEIGRNQNQMKYVSMELNQETGLYEGEYTFSAQDHPGEYYITYAHIMDHYGFYTSYSSNSKRVMKRMLPGSVILENEAYEQSFRNIVFEEKGKTLRPGDTIHVSFDLPKALKIQNFSVDFYGSSGLYLHYYYAEYSGNTGSGEWSYDPETGIVSCSYVLKETDTNGRMYLGYISVYASDNRYVANNLGNSRAFYLTGATESGASEESDTPISIEDVTGDFDGKTLVDGDSLTVQYRVNTPGEVTESYLRLDYFDSDDDNAGSGYYTSISHSVRVNAEPVEGEDGVYRAVYSLAEDDLYGVYSVSIYVDARFNLSEEEGYASYEHESITENTNLMFRFDKNPEAVLNRLAPATDLHWTEDGRACFTLPDDFQGRVSIRLHRAGSGLNNWITGYTNSYVDEDDRDWYRDEGENLMGSWGEPESGKYYFSVTMRGDGVNYFDSPSARSELFTYTLPEKKLATVTKFEWDEQEKALLCTLPEQEAEPGMYWAECRWLFAETEDETPQECHWYSGGWTDENGIAHLEIFDSILQEYGAGYYYVYVRVCSENIFEYMHSDWSELSPGFYAGASDPHGDDDEPSVIKKLDDVVTENKTADEIREQVQQISTEDLKIALLTDESVADTLRSLEIEANAVTQVTTAEDMPGNVKEIVSQISAIGAGLNNMSNGETPKLVIEKPKQEDVLPAQYNNAFAIRFSMELENVENPDNLRVPVLIDIPVPAGIVPAYMVILHYHLSTGEPELIHPYTYQAGNKWYAQFALTRFSDFVVTHDLSQDGVNKLTLPADLTEIGEEAFKGVSAVIIEIPEGVTTIGARAFSNCQELMQVYLPNSVTSIAEDAFAGCRNVSIITDNERIKGMPAFANLILQK